MERLGGRRSGAHGAHRKRGGRAIERRRTGWAFFVEVGITLTLTVATLHAITCEWRRDWNLAVATGLVLAYVALCVAPPARRCPGGVVVRQILTGLLAGLLVYRAFCLAGLLDWPLGRPENTRAYAYLLYCHVVLALTIGAAVLWSARGERIPHLLAWGESGRIVFAATICAAAAWLRAIHYVGTTEVQTAGSLALLLPIALAKACITGIGEEAYYRGVLMPVATARWGARVGIVFQACVYAAFHMHLGTMVFGRAGFVLAVFALGLMFGVVTHLTRGIGWASVTHVALNVWVEWSNLC